MALSPQGGRALFFIYRRVLEAAGRWVKIYYGWRPNLRDEGDNHLIELAVVGSARAVVTHNVRDLRRAELRWTDLLVLTPSECLEKLP